MIDEKQAFIVQQLVIVDLDKVSKLLERAHNLLFVIYNVSNSQNVSKLSNILREISNELGVCVSGD